MGNRSGTSLSLWERFGKALLIGVLFLLSGGVILITGDVESSAVAKVLWSGIYAIAALITFQSSRSVVQSMRASPAYILLAVLCLGSIFWTSHRGVTTSYAIAFFGSTLVAYLMATKVEPVSLLRMVAIALLILLSVNFALMLPDAMANLSPNIRYAGVFPQSNMLGRVAGLGVVLFSALMVFGGLSRLWGSCGLIMGVLLLVSCDSMTSVLAAMLAVGIVFLRKLIGRPIGTGHIAVITWFVLCLSGLVWVSWTTITEFAFGLMGRSTSFTGRTALWGGVWDAILKKPVLGYGYAGFWSGERLITKQLLDAAGWSTSSAHNGLFDIALHLGFVGVAVFAWGIWRSLMTGLKLAFRRDSVLAVILLSLLCYLVLLGVTESAYMMRNSIFWVLIVVCSVYLRRLRDGEFLNETIEA
jgi:exopolysaccharide production protein ExoQ